MLKQWGLREGDAVDVVLKEDPEPEKIDFAEELLTALAQDPEARRRWDSFTLGKKRSLNLYVTTAKRAETRERRAVEIVEKIRNRTLYGDQ